MNSRVIHVLSAVVAVTVAQRSPYAGRRPIGYPAIEPTTQGALSNRFGDESSSGSSTTTQRLPIEALGDRDLVNRISKLPRDHQPFWYINWQHLEQQRQRPQSYPQRVNSFIDGSSNSAFFLQK